MHRAPGGIQMEGFRIVADALEFVYSGSIYLHVPLRPGSRDTAAAFVPEKRRLPSAHLRPLAVGWLKPRSPGPCLPNSFLVSRETCRLRQAELLPGAGPPDLHPRRQQRG